MRKILKTNVCRECGNRYVVETKKARFVKNVLCPDCRIIRGKKPKLLVQEKLKEGEGK